MNCLKKLLLLLFLIFVLITTARCGKKNRSEKDEYDFIIIGGGLAGCVVATRLSENFSFSVLLLEAGGKPPLFSQIPAAALIFNDPKYNWNLTTIPQRNMDNRVFTLRPGKMLGGSGSTNWLNWVRANKRDFDEWEKMRVKDWLWEDVLPYYKKIESDFSMKSDSKYSGFNGPIRITAPWNDVTLYSAFLNEARRRGYKYNDALDGNQIGYNIARINVYNNERQSSYTNYLIPALKRKNLKVIHSALVEKILFSDTNEAVGVLYAEDNEKFEAKARREVIVSAGALNTPKILMLSGIGPRNHLNSLKIEVLSDLLVGDNYYTHNTINKLFSKTSSKNIKNDMESYKNFSGANIFLNTDLSTDHDFPDAKIQMLGELIDPNTNQIHYNMDFEQQRPKSRGTIRLASIDPNDPPLIDSNLFADNSDLQVLLRMAQFYAITVMNLEKAQNEFIFEKFDDRTCKHMNLKSDDYWRCIVMNNVRPSSYHCCSARMGSPSDPLAVVDYKLNVIGVKKLRVIDASVMPTVTSANLQTIVLMIAERGSDFIKKYHF